MAFPTLDRALDALSDFFDGASVPLDLEQPPPGTEDAPVGLYNVGQIVRQYIRQWLGVEPNLATPGNILQLLLTLDELTAQLEDQMAEQDPTHWATRTASLGVMAAALPGLGAGLWMALDKANRDNERSLESVRVDLKRWRIRLDEYIRHTESAPDPEDRWYTLYEVTAPLFLGWYGGKTGVEVELPAGGFPRTFDPAVQHIADLSTPFQIANQLGVWLEWDARKKRLLVEDIKDEANELVEDAKDAAAAAASPVPYLLAGLAIGGVGTAVGTALIRSKIK